MHQILRTGGQQLQHILKSFNLLLLKPWKPDWKHVGTMWLPLSWIFVAAGVCVLWMDLPAKGDSVSGGEGELVRRGERGSGSLWHRSQLHSSARSRWTDGRTDRKTERGEGGEAQVFMDAALPPPAPTVLLQKVRRGRRKGMPEDNRQTTSNGPMWERFRNEAKTAQHRLSWKSDSWSVRLGQEGKSSVSTQRREREKPECGEPHSCRRTSGGCWIRDCVQQKQPKNIVSCRKATCTGILCLQQNKG